MVFTIKLLKLYLILSFFAALNGQSDISPTTSVSTADTLSTLQSSLETTSSINAKTTSEMTLSTETSETTTNADENPSETTVTVTVSTPSETDSVSTTGTTKGLDTASTTETSSLSTTTQIPTSAITTETSAVTTTTETLAVTTTTETSTVTTTTETSTVTTTTETPTTTELRPDTSVRGQWYSQDYPEPYKPGIYEYSIHYDEGYAVELTIDDLDLDGSTQDYLLVKPGLSLTDEGSVYVFTWYLNSARSFIVPYNSVYIRFVANSDKLTYRGFKLTYNRYGEVTTTLSTTTGKNWPTPGPSDNVDITVYIGGKSAEGLYIYSQTFINMLVEMSTRYCVEHNITLVEEITEDNILLETITRCPYDWPDSEECTEVHFAIPVIWQNSSEYQLNSVSLRQMWNQYADQYLKNIGLYVYYNPDNQKYLIYWLAGCAAVLVAFIIVLYFVWRYSYTTIENSQRRLSDTDSIVSNEFRKSEPDVSWFPAPHQLVPPFFERENEYFVFEPDGPNTQAYPYHNAPGIGAPPAYGFDNFGLNIDELSEEEIMPHRNSMILFGNEGKNESIL